MRSAAFVIIAALGLGASAAHGDPNVRDARAHFEQARAYQAVGEFLKAADEYKEAYALAPRPELLFDIAQAYRLAGSRKLAIDYFNRYVKLQPEGPGAKEARQHIATLTKELDDAAAQAPKPPPRAPASASTQTQVVASEGSPTLRIAGIASTSVGVVAIGLGIELGRIAEHDASEVSNHSTPWTNADKQTYLNGQHANTAMIASYIAGGGLIAGGGILYWRGSRQQVSAVAAPHTVGLAMTGRF